MADDYIGLKELAAMYPPTKLVVPKLIGDCTKLGAAPTISGEDEHILAVAQLLGSAAKFAGEWVGLNLMTTAKACGFLGPSGPLIHPAVWIQVFFSDHLVRGFRMARTAGLCTISDGYAYPTQKLADRLMAEVTAAPQDDPPT